jgi:isocitrate dehydrogenase (NAD+)
LWQDTVVPLDLTLIPGDGVGPELVAAARRAIEATGVDVRWDVQEAGASVAEREGTPLPDRVLDSVRRTRVALKGPMSTPVSAGYRSPNVALRKELDLFAGVRPCVWHPGVRSRYRDVDLVVIRENTEDMYTGVEFEQGTPAASRLIRFIAETTGRRVREDAGLSIKTNSERASERIVRFAFGWARRHGRSRITVGHKANIMKFSDGLFLAAARRVASGAGDIAFEDRIIDALCMELARRPETFDVVVLPNLYGDLVSDLAAGCVGGFGVAPGANLGDDLAVFEASHGSAPRHAGRDRMNPTGLILSGAMMLRHLGEAEAADRLEGAVWTVIGEGRTVTGDLLPRDRAAEAVGTTAFTDAVTRALAA